MKVLHINSYYGNRFFYKNLYDRQVNNHMDLDVFVPVAKGTVIKKDDLGPYTRVFENHGKYDRFLFHLKHNKIVKSLDENYSVEKYDLMHAHSLFSNGYIAYKMHEKYGVDYIVAVRMPDIYTFFKYMIYLRKTGINILKHAKKIVFLSEGFRETLIEEYVHEELKQSFYDKSIIIPNGVAPYWLENKNEPKYRPDQPVKLLQVGLISKLKNSDKTLQALDILSERGIKATGTFVGESVDKKMTENIKNHSAAEYIPRVDKEKLTSLYRSHDIFILPSLKETFGLVYVEAMTQGLPVLYSAGQGFDKQYEEGVVGYSLDNSSAEDMADKIELALKNYDSLSANGIINSDDFSWDHIEKTYSNLYSSALK